MHIGISTSVIQRGKTGVAQYVFALLRAMLPYGGEHRFTIFSLREDMELFDFALAGAKILPVEERHRPPVANILWHQRQLPALARQLGLDVLHIPSYRRLLWSSPCASVATIHDLAPFKVRGKYDWKRMFYGRVIVRRLAKRQDEVIAISQNTGGDIVRFFGLPRRKLTVVYNGIDHERFHPGSAAQAKARVETRHKLSPPFVLYVARLEHPGKNHIRLIEAFERFKSASQSPWRLVLAGSDWHGAEAIHERIRRSTFAADIVRLGFVPDGDLPDLYRAAEAFVYPSLYEGFGMPPLEAMACGCPVISSAAGSLDEVLGDAALVVDPERIEQITAALARLSDDAELRSKLRGLGLEQARRFNWEEAAAQTLRVYQRACNYISRPEATANR